MDEPIKLGRHHPLLRRVRRLRRERAFRDEQARFVAEGLHLAAEALDAGAGIEVALATETLLSRAEGRRIWARLGQAGVALRLVSRSMHPSLTDARSPQPLTLVVRRREIPPSAVLGHGPAAPLVVVAHGVQDPGNLGAIVRTAEAAGGSGVLVTGPAADLYHPRTVRATMGAVFRLPVARSTAASALATLTGARVRLLAADPSRGRDHDAVDFRGPTAILLGGEGAGLPQELRDQASGAIRIPMAEPVESLSVAAATAVLLFEAARQRRREAGGVTPDG